MKIIRHSVSRVGKDVLVAFIDTGGIDLGIDTIGVDPTLTNSQTEDEKLPVETSYTDDVDPEIEPDGVFEGDEDQLPDIPPVSDTNGAFDLNRLYFYIDTFKKLTAVEGLWSQILLAANRFFETLDEDDQRKFCLFYIFARRTIDRDLVRGQITEVTTALGNQFYDLAVDMDLPEKVLHYVKTSSGIPIPDLTYAGTNVGRDDPELTFHMEEYYILLTISVICKILCPIWGDVVERMVGSVDNEMKETHCMNVIEPILTLPTFRTVRNKLYNYVSRIVDTALNGAYETASFTATVSGVSRDRFCQIVFSTLIVKRYVTVDLYKTEPTIGNIMIWTWTCAKSSFSSLQQTLNKRCRIMPRVNIFESPDHSGDDERRISLLEQGSHITDVTADMPVLIRFGVKMAIGKLLREFDISETDYKYALTYYYANPIQVTTLNKILVGVFIGNQIGGAQGLKYLNLPLFTELVTITQIYIATRYSDPDTVNLLTATTSDEEKAVPELSGTNTRILTTARQTLEYRSCEDSSPLGKITINGISTSTVLRRLQDHITKYHHYANTAPLISAIMDKDPPARGSLILYEEDVMQSYCRIILGVINPTGSRMVKEKQTPFGE